jgi:hypothetical protein
VVWVSVDKLSAVKGKDNMVMVDVSYKSYPESLIELIGTYLSVRKKLESYFHRLKDREIIINNETSQQMKFNNYIECHFGERMIESKLIAVAVNKCIILIPGIDPNLAVGFEFITKFYFQKYRFAIKGKIEKLNKRNDGFVSVDIVSEYFIKTGSLDKQSPE